MSVEVVVLVLSGLVAVNLVLVTALVTTIHRPEPAKPPRLKPGGVQPAGPVAAPGKVGVSDVESSVGPRSGPV